MKIILLARGILLVALALIGSVTYGQENSVTAMESPNAKAKATIIFFRTGVGGGAVQFHVHNMDGDPVGYLGKSGDSFSIEVDPGTHQYWSRAARRNDVVLTVEPGKTYYVKATVNMGFVVGRPVLKEVSESQAPESVK